MLKNTMKTKSMLESILVVIGFLLGCILIIAAFASFWYISENWGDVTTIGNAVGMFAVGLSYLIMILYLIGIVGSSKINIFVIENIKRFKIIGYILFINVVLEYISMLLNKMVGFRLLDLFPGIFITPGMAIYFITGLLCFVIADAFNEAIKIKNDNDLTI